MLKLMRLIFRVDFPVSPEMANRPGDAINILLSRDRYWGEVSDNPSMRSLKAVFKDTQQSIIRDINLETRSINGNIYFFDGMHFDDDGKLDYIDHVHDIIDEATRKFSINIFNRVGIRFFVFGFSTLEDLVEDQPRRFSVVDAKHLALFEEHLGTVTDQAIILEGTTKDKVSYRLQSGPFGPGDKQRVLGDAFGDRFKAEVPEGRPPVNPHIFMYDFDLFERDLDLPRRSFKRWARTKWHTAHETGIFLQDAIYRNAR